MSISSRRQIPSSRSTNRSSSGVLSASIAPDRQPRWARGTAVLDVRRVAELRRLRELESRYRLLREEHELLKKPSGLLRIEGGRLRVH